MDESLIKKKTILKLLLKWFIVLIFTQRLWCVNLYSLQVRPLLCSHGDPIPSQRTGCPWWQPGRPRSKPPAGTAPSSSSGPRCRQWSRWCWESAGTRSKWWPSSCHTLAPRLQWQQGKSRKWNRVLQQSSQHKNQWRPIWLYVSLDISMIYMYNCIYKEPVVEELLGCFLFWFVFFFYTKVPQPKYKSRAFDIWLKVHRYKQLDVLLKVRYSFYK